MSGRRKIMLLTGEALLVAALIFGVMAVLVKGFSSIPFSIAMILGLLLVMFADPLRRERSN